MVDIRLIQCKNQQTTSKNRRNIGLHKEILVKESNAGVRIFSCLRMRIENMVKVL